MKKLRPNQCLVRYKDPWYSENASLHASPLAMPSSTVSEFATFVRNSDSFMGRRKLVDRVRFRPGHHGDFLSLKTAHDPLSLWTVGRVSPSDLFVSPNGTFNKDYAAGTADQKIKGIRFRLRLVDPEHPEFSPLFVESIAGIKSLQALYPGKEPRNLLDSDGGYDQIRLSAKSFEKVCPVSSLHRVTDCGPGEKQQCFSIQSVYGNRDHMANQRRSV